jgi:hypothetical protein
MKKRHIAILFHKHDRELNLERYVITSFARIWREEGHEVSFLFGLEKFVPADLGILHVNLSVVPDEYLEFARRYPIVLNGEARDIRKSTISENLVRRGDCYQGRVIVKADLNHGGIPERRLSRSRLLRSSRLARKISRRLSRSRATRGIDRPMAYRVYERPADVPAAYFDAADLVVERFLPEREGDLYFARSYQFLGDRWTCARLAARQPIVNGKTMIRSERVDPHPEIVERRHKLRFDYGKFDYVIHEGRPVLLDANKTTGTGIPYSLAREEARRHRAGGIHSYFDDADD